MADKDNKAYQQLNKEKFEATSVGMPSASFIIKDNCLESPTTNICELCNRTFLLEKELMKHLKIEHLIERQVECDLCKRTFKSLGYLNNHLRSHNSEKPFPCTYCERAFKRKHNMIAHTQITHLGLNATTYESMLSASMNKKQKVKLFTCAFCQEKFKLKMVYQNHVKIHLKKRALTSNNREKTIDYSLIPIECVASEPSSDISTEYDANEPSACQPKSESTVARQYLVEKILNYKPIIMPVSDGNFYEIVPDNDHELYVIHQ